MKLRLTVTPDIVKAIQQGLFGGLPRKGGKYVPKKVQARRGGKTYQTTVWVDPTKEEAEQPSLFPKPERTATQRKPEQPAQPTLFQQPARESTEPAEPAKPAKPATPKGAPKRPALGEKPVADLTDDELRMEERELSRDLSGLHPEMRRNRQKRLEAVGQETHRREVAARQERERARDKHDLIGTTFTDDDGQEREVVGMDDTGRYRVSVPDARSTELMDARQIQLMQQQGRQEKPAETPDARKQAERIVVEQVENDPMLAHMLERATSRGMRNAALNTNVHDVLGVGGWLQRRHPNLYKQLGDDDRNAIFDAVREHMDRKLRNVQEDEPEPAAAEEPPARTEEDERAARQAKHALSTYAEMGGRTRDKVDPNTQYVYASPLRPLGSWAGRLHEGLRNGTLEIVHSQDQTILGQKAHSYVFSNEPLDPEAVDAYELEKVKEPAGGAATKDRLDTARTAGFEAGRQGANQKAALAAHLAGVDSQAARAAIASAFKEGYADEGGTMEEARSREAEPIDHVARHASIVQETQWKREKVDKARSAVQELRDAGLATVAPSVEHLVAALNSGRVDLHRVASLPAFQGKKALHKELQRLQQAEGRSVVGQDRIAQHFNQQVAAHERDETIPDPRDTMDAPGKAAPTAEGAAEEGPEVGDEKVEDGRRYRLNKNHRWERIDDEEKGLDSGPAEGYEGLLRHARNVLLNDKTLTSNEDPNTTRIGLEQKLDGVMAQLAAQGDLDAYKQYADDPAMKKRLLDDLMADLVPPAGEAPPSSAQEPAEEKPWTDDARAYVGRLADKGKKDYALPYGRYLTRGGERPTTDLPDDRRQDVEKKMQKHLGIPDRPGATPAGAREGAPAAREADKAAPKERLAEQALENEEERRAALDYGKDVQDVLKATPTFGFEAVPGGATKANRKAANTSALALADQLLAENRPPTPEERATLAAYTGDGGLDTGDLNAHYTPTGVAAAMWKLLHQAGLTGGRVLEPSMGAGVFMETAPANVEMSGVELGTDTSKIAKLLHPNARVHDGQAFEEYNITSDDEPFDAVIANPPYGVRGRWAGIDREHVETQHAEDYFIERSLDRLKDGGLAAFLINPGPLDNESRRDFRARLLARAEVLGTVQLTSYTFRESGSAVPPALLLLRKRPHEVGGTLARLLDKHGEGVLTAAGVTDEAFLNGESLSQPDNMLGEHNPDKSYRYKHIDGAMDEAALTRLAARDLPAPAGPRTPDDLAAAVEGTVTPDDIDSARAYALTRDYPIPEGTISQDGRYILRGSRWHRLDEGDPALSTSRGLAEDLQRFMRLRNDDPVAAEAQRQALAQRVQAFMDEYGDPNEHDRITERAKDVHGLAHLLAAVEGGTLAGHLTQPVRAPQGLDDTNPHAVAAHLHRSGRLTPETLARRWAKDGRDEATTEEARAFLMQHYAVDENGAWMPEPAFYQGNVPEKEAMLQRAAASARAAGDEELAGQYDRQRERLRELLPRKSIEDFDVTPRSPWIPANAVEAFIEQVLDEGSDYTVTTDRGVVYVQRHGYGVLPREVEEFQRYLNHATRVDAVRDQKSKSKSAIQAERKANIERAKLAEERFQRQFRAWVGDSDYREAVEGAYNERINNWLEPDYASTPIHIPGWNPDLKLHSWQHAYVAKAATMGSSLNAHDVGLGKTFAGIALLAKLRREGQAKKPMIVCPKSLIPNWVKNSAFATPDDNVLVVGQTETGKDEDGKPIFRDDTEKDVARKLVQIATGDWDKVIISKNWFATIPIKDENVDRLTMTDPEMMRMDELRSDDEEGREAYKGQARRKRGKSARDIVKDREKAQQKVRKRMFKHMVNPLHWEDLGVDALMVDEAHMYKNLYAAPSTFGQQPKFMGGSAESKQAMDFLFKSRLLRERTGGSGIHLLTATPTKNSPLEVFNMLRHVAPAFDEVAPTVDAFVSRYANIGTAFTPDAKGDLTTTPAVVGFQNLTELRNLMGRWVDRKTADDVGLELPERDDHEAYFDLHPDVQPMYQRLAEEAKDAAGKRDAEGEDHLFAKFAQMQKLTLDPALIDPSLGNLPNPRYERAAEVARNALSEDGKVVMFMDFGQAEADTDPEDLDDDVESLDAYDRLLKHLADAGVPRDQIAVATAKTLKDTAARGEIESRFEKGDLRVVIGSTGVIGEGFNLQAGTTDMVHLNTPWDPGTYWQRLGRAVRQGNPVEKVRNHVMLAKGSFDGLTYSTMLGKRGWMDHLWNSDTDQASNETGANQYEEIVSMLSADPDQAREFMRKKKEEMNQQAEQAMRVASLRSLGEYGRKRAAHTGATQRLQSAETRLQDAQEKLQQEVDPDRAQKLRERVTHLEKQTETYQQRRDTLEQQMRSASTTLAQDENLPTEFTPLLDDPDRPFVVDNKGGVYTPGSVFQLPRRDGSMDIARVENVDHVKQTVTVSPAIPSPHASSRARTIDLADLARSSGHALELSDDVYGQAAVQRASMGPQGLKDVSPERVAKHADEIQEALQKHGPSRAYVVTRDGNVEYRQADRAFNSVELGEDERFLLNTTEDRDRFTRTFPNGVDAPMGLPFAVRHKMFDDPDSPYGRTYRMALEENPEYLIKATPPPPPRPHARLRIRGGTLPRMFAKAPATGYPLQGRRKWRGLDVSIEHRRGSTRSGTDPDGNDWSTTMTHDYGYLRGTEGTDGDHLDVFMGDAKAARKVYVIHILRPDTGEYDEDKVMLDFSSADAARHAFDRNYDRPTRFYGGMTEWPADEFARLCRDGKLKGRVVMGQPRKTARRPELERLLDIARGGRTVRATLRGGR